MAEVKLQWAPLTPLKKENVENIGDNKPGVYRLSYAHDNGSNFVVFYVGKSDDIKKELLSFLNNTDSIENSCVSIHIKTFECRFRYTEIDDLAIRDAAERQVCKFYQPSCNAHTQLVDEDIIINIS